MPIDRGPSNEAERVIQAGDASGNLVDFNGKTWVIGGLNLQEGDRGVMYSDRVVEITKNAANFIGAAGDDVEFNFTTQRQEAGIGNAIGKLRKATAAGELTVFVGLNE